MDEYRYQPDGWEETWLSLSMQPTACLLASNGSYVQIFTHDMSGCKSLQFSQHFKLASQLQS
jgi:hypothetical protein